MARYDEADRDRLAQDFARDGWVVLPAHFDPAILLAWHAAFTVLHERQLAQIAADGNGNRGTARHYLTLPFDSIFADPRIFCDDDVLALVERVAGADPVMCQLASDTPLFGSTYQDWHRDTPSLFDDAPETPSFQLALNFPLVDVTLQNGALETTRGTHRMSGAQALQALQDGRCPSERMPMRLGDAVLRDVRCLHRGTPNLTQVARPMVVIGYSRAWYLRPEVHIDVPRATYAALPARAQRLLRHNPRVDELQHAAPETYERFAY